MKFKVSKKQVTLDELRPGSLFMCGDTLGLKSEYRTSNGVVDAYIVGSGEQFWGNVKTPEEQNALLVYPVKIKKKKNKNEQPI